MSLRAFFGTYARHGALNLGQALQGIRYATSHPDIDAEAPRHTVRHAVLSLRLRAKRVANDLFFAVLPPQTHHTAEELAGMRAIPLGRWFRYGYCAWRFDDTGEPKDPLPPTTDRRWDPRCRSGSAGS